MVGFSVSLKGQKAGQKGSVVDKRKKRSNVFNETDLGETKKSRIRVTHVGGYQEQTRQELVIKPEGNKKVSQNNLADEEIPETQLKFGLNAGREVPQAEHQKPDSLFIDNKHNFRDTLDQPEITEQEEYEAVPIEEFGDALLRGMGWNGTDRESKDPSGEKKAVQFRPALLGLGAKAVQSTHVDQATQSRPFLPVKKIDKHTGKHL
ncbi:LADA_0G14444g1_1 [Lachancea dasiensis]|uniref:Pre-mRNA-splicing factor n=1 Tax=Lachancea dasiensis TaxID=1072105 RepID=A0A1G4JWD8_9SACH|nr:LADA_0G14444g1_1 [Lachancea dasiensis]